MDFITSQQQPIETSGSHLVGVVVASYNMLKTAFGDACGGDGYKTEVEWAIQFEDGTIATIYDWKEGDCYHGEGQGTHFSKVEEWHIGGFNGNAELRVLEVLTGIQDMVNTGTPLEDIPPTEDEYEVQEWTLCDGWTNTWLTYDDKGNEVPSTFKTKEDAQAELDDFFYQCEQAVKDGNMEDVPDREDFQIVKVE